MDDSDPNEPTEGQRIANDVYWRQEHEGKGKHRLDRLAELIDEALLVERAKNEAATHMQAMMDQADDLNSTMNNAGFKYLGHLAIYERARVSLAFSAMVMDYAKRNGFAVTNPTETW